MLALLVAGSENWPDEFHEETGYRDSRNSFDSKLPRAILTVVAGLVFGIAVVVAALAVAWPAHADPDTDFANELHTYGISGQKDYTTVQAYQFLGAPIAR
jgi:hypothetical protein